MRVHATYVDHIVLTVSDLEKSKAWWSHVTGVHPTRDYEGEVSIHIGGQAIRLRQGTPNAASSVSICVVSDASIHDIYDRVESLGVQHDETHSRTGSTGPLWALTLHDPDGYVVELATGTPEAHG